jgi:hypothetical protein
MVPRPRAHLDGNVKDQPQEDVGAGVELDSAIGSTNQTSHRDKRIMLNMFCTYEESVVHILLSLVCSCVRIADLCS